VTPVPAWRAALRLTRPRQWPILSAQLAVGVLLARTPDAPAPAALPLAAAWLAWVVLLNGGTLAFNSAYDRDVGPVAYLRRPPQPPRGLAGWATGWMAAGALLGWWAVGPLFGAVTAACVGLSILYSHPVTRWKARPGLDLLVNMAGYGAGTTLAGLAAAGAAGWSGVRPDAPAAAWFVGGFALLFGSLYPLTQIYQHGADRERGDRTLATALGPRPSLLLALVLGAAASALLLGAPVSSPAWARWALAGVLTVWLGHLAWWWLRAPRWPPARHERGMYHALALWGLVDVALVLPRVF
jgi:hypothetical protein